MANSRQRTLNDRLRQAVKMAGIRGSVSAKNGIRTGIRGGLGLAD